MRRVCDQHGGGYLRGLCSQWFSAEPTLEHSLFRIHFTSIIFNSIINVARSQKTVPIHSMVLCHLLIPRCVNSLPLEDCQHFCLSQLQQFTGRMRGKSQRSKCLDSRIITQESLGNTGRLLRLLLSSEITTKFPLACPLPAFREQKTDGR